MGNKKILLGLTTTPDSDWRAKIEEIDKFGIKEIALFPTCLEIEQRREIYDLLEKTCLETVPHVHLRNDTENWELDYLSLRYRTHLFNIHANTESQKILDYPNYRDKIFIENVKNIDDLFIGMLKISGGICLDIAHWVDSGILRKNSSYNKFPEFLEKYKIGCCHISVLRKSLKENSKKLFFYGSHYLDNKKGLDYILPYVKYLPEYISIELENSFEEQLGIKKYLEELIK